MAVTRTGINAMAPSAAMRVCCPNGHTSTRPGVSWAPSVALLTVRAVRWPRMAASSPLAAYSAVCGDLLRGRPVGG